MNSLLRITDSLGKRHYINPDAIDEIAQSGDGRTPPRTRLTLRSGTTITIPCAVHIVLLTPPFNVWGERDFDASLVAVQRALAK